MEKGKYVSRSAFAKLQGEKNRLLADIRTIVENTDGQGMAVLTKWRKHFNDQKDLKEALREILKTELPKFKEKNIVAPPRGPNIECA